LLYGYLICQSTILQRPHSSIQAMKFTQVYATELFCIHCHINAWTKIVLPYVPGASILEEVYLWREDLEEGFALVGKYDERTKKHIKNIPKADVLSTVLLRDASVTAFTG